MTPFTLVHCDYTEYSALLRADARSGFTGVPLNLPSRWGFDGRGRVLFHRLAHRPGPHPFAAEAALFRRYVRELNDGRPRTIVHIGPQNLWCVDDLIVRLHETGLLRGVIVCDTPHGSHDWSLARLAPTSEAYHVVGALPSAVPPLPGRAGRLFTVPLVTFGSLTPADRAQLLTGLRKRGDTGDLLLVTTAHPPGLDVLAEFLAAEPDAAEFNRNVLNVVNHTLDTDADATGGTFAHLVRRFHGDERLELRLTARTAARLELRNLGFHVDVAAGNELITFTLRAGHRAPETELAEAGWRLRRGFADEESATVWLAEAV